MCQDVIELEQNEWEPRRQELQAKKIEDIHKEAKAEEEV